MPYIRGDNALGYFVILLSVRPTKNKLYGAAYSEKCVGRKAMGIAFCRNRPFVRIAVEQQVVIEQNGRGIVFRSENNAAKAMLDSILKGEPFASTGRSKDAL